MSAFARQQFALAHSEERQREWQWSRFCSVWYYLGAALRYEHCEWTFKVAHIVATDLTA